MKTYKVIYRIDQGIPGRFQDVELIVDHRPELGFVQPLPDGSGRFGRVISVQRVKEICK